MYVLCILVLVIYVLCILVLVMCVILQSVIMLFCRGFPFGIFSFNTCLLALLLLMFLPVHQKPNIEE
jgi:hypothetical protein